MTAPKHKRAVREAFSRSAQDYDSVAEIQRQIASKLAQVLSIRPESTILDAGSGTGFLAHLVKAQESSSNVIALDHAFTMCERSNKLPTICADVESLPVRSEVVDIYCSSLAWQWTSPLPSAIEAARVLRKHGLLAVATLGPASLQELRQAFAGVDTHRHVLAFRSPEEYRQSLVQAGFTDITICNHVLKTFSPDVSCLIKDIRTLGAQELNSPRRQGLIGRRSWARIQAAYETLREPLGLPLSYDAIYLYARKA